MHVFYCSSSKLSCKLPLALGRSDKDTSDQVKWPKHVQFKVSNFKVRNVKSTSWMTNLTFFDPKTISDMFHARNRFEKLSLFKKQDHFRKCNRTQDHIRFFPCIKRLQKLIIRKTRQFFTSAKNDHFCKFCKGFNKFSENF